jgi:hypothetical protein
MQMISPLTFGLIEVQEMNSERLILYLQCEAFWGPSLPCCLQSYGKEKLSLICWLSVEIVHGKKKGKQILLIFLAEFITFPPMFLASVIRNWLARFARTGFPRQCLLAHCWLAVVNLLSLTHVIQKSKHSLEMSSMNLVSHIWRISQM